MMNIEMPSRDAEVIANAIGELGMKIDRLTSALKESAADSKDLLNSEAFQKAVQKAIDDRTRECLESLERMLGKIYAPSFSPAQEYDHSQNL